MEFERPVVSPEHIMEIMAPYGLGEIVGCEYLGGVPNVTYKVDTLTRVVAVRISNRGYSSTAHIKLELELLEHLVAVGFPEAPRLVAGGDGQIMHQWKGFWVCATEFIPGLLADQAEITPELCMDVGRVVASLRQAMASFSSEAHLEGETLVERGAKLLHAFPAALRARGWDLDISNVQHQWDRASGAYLSNLDNLNQHIIHADIWPPNVICNGATVVGLIDFDDWCYGATIFDVCAPLIEFPMYNTLDFREDLATSFFQGYFAHGGTLSEVDESILLDCMEMACAIWLACNVIQNPVFAESEIYLRKLNLLRDVSSRERMRALVRQCIRAAIDRLSPADGRV
jgi:homoserine kinase type II